MVLNALINNRLNYYKTKDPYKLLVIINNKYKDAFDLDKLMQFKDIGSVFNINHILSNRFTQNDFSKLSKDFEDKIKDSLLNKSINIDELLVDILLLIHVNTQVSYKN